MYHSLPKREKTISIDVTDEFGVHFKGDFVIRTVLNLSQNHALELEKSRLLGDSVNPTVKLTNIAISLATIRHHVIKSPDWWRELGEGSQILDATIILEIYDKIIDAENKWREDIKKAAEKAKKEQEEEDKEKEASEGK